jgi:hypothetical protein
MSKPRNNINNLHGLAQFALFVSSYLPLFILIIARQVSENFDYFHWAGFNLIGIKFFVLKFGLSSVLSLASIIGFFGFIQTFGNIQEVAKNGFPVKVKDVKNKNSESIGYIATYIIPLLFQSFSGWFECLSVLFILAIIYRIYINSSLLLINPLLSFRYAIYEIEYTFNEKTKNGLIISKDKYLEEDTNIKLYEIGYKLYFATTNNSK